MTIPNTVPCKGCGKPIVWAQVTRGDGSTVRMPLDAKAPTYYLSGKLGDGTVMASRADGQGRDAAGTLTSERAPIAYVSHFATCSKANDFSGGKRG